MGTRKIMLGRGVGGNLVPVSHPIQGGVEIILVTKCYKNWISSGGMGHLARHILYLTFPLGSLLLTIFIFIRACRGKTATDVVNTQEMKELLTSPIMREAKPVTNGAINEQASDSGIH